MFSKSSNHAAIPDQKRGGFAVKLLIGLLLLSHVGWIGVHLNLVARGQINPWKLGGFAMYVAPRPPVKVVLYRRAEGARDRSADGALEVLGLRIAPSAAPEDPAKSDGESTAAAAPVRVGSRPRPRLQSIELAQLDVELARLELIDETRGDGALIEL